MDRTLIPVKLVLFIEKKKFKGISQLCAVPTIGEAFVVTGNTFTCNSFAPTEDGYVSGEMVPLTARIDREAAEQRLISGGFVEVSEPTYGYVAKKPALEELLQEC